MNYYDFLSVGIDVGSEISWAYIMTPDYRAVTKPIKIDHLSIESLDALKRAIKKAEEANSLKARIFLESTGIYHVPLFYHLTESGFRVFLLNPLITDSNKNQSIRKVKSDKEDAKRIAKIGFTSDLKSSLIPQDHVLNVRTLTREYHKLSDDRTAYLNQLTKELAIVFPSYVKVFSTILGKTSVAILKIYRTPQALLKASKDELVAVIMEHSKSGLNRSLKTYDKLMDAAKLAVVFSHQLSASYEVIAMKLDSIEMIDRQKIQILERIRKYLDEYSDTEFVHQERLLESLKGVGFISAVSLMSEIGDFSAFTKPKQLVAFFGIDPAVNQSGKFKGTKVSMSKRGSRIARRVLFIIAVAAIRTTVKGDPINSTIRDYYLNLLISKPKKVAIGAVMRKLTNIIYAILRDDEPYRMLTPEEHCKEYNAKILAA